MCKKGNTKRIKGIFQRSCFGVALMLGLLYLSACAAEKVGKEPLHTLNETEDLLPLSVTMTKDDFEITLSVPKSIYYLEELRKEDCIRSEVTVRYIGEEEEVLVAHNRTLLSMGFRSYEEEGSLPALNEGSKTSFQKGQSRTYEFDWEEYSRGYSEQGIHKVCTMIDLEYLDLETEEGTGKKVKFGLSLFPIEIRTKQGEPLATDAYEMLWGALPEKKYLTEKAEAYAEELRETEPEREIEKVLAGKEDALVQYAVFYEEEGVLSEIEVVTPHGREFFSVGKEGEKLRLYEEDPPELSVDGTHVQFSTLSEDTGEIITYRVYVREYEWGRSGEEYYSYIEVTGKVR